MNRSFSRVVLASLALPFALSTAAQAQPKDEGLPPPYERTAALGAPKPKPEADGFLGRRPLLKDLSDADQKLLASLILEYTTANRAPS